MTAKDILEAVGYWLPVFEDGSDGGGGGGGDGGDGGSGGDGDDKGLKDDKTTKTFTQDQVNKMLAEDRRKHASRTQKAIDELNALKERANITANERAELESRIEEMSNQLLTKEELAKKDLAKAEKKSKEIQESLTVDRDFWKNRYTQETIDRAIIGAAVEHNAFNPEQIVAMLGPHTRLVEESDDEGKPNGQYATIVKFADTDDEGKPITLDLSVKDAVKRMTEIDKFLNLFKTEGQGGLGAHSKAGGKPLNIAEIAKDPAKYREWRKKNPL